VKTKYWIQAARLRTLPLALSCILMGAGLAKLCAFEITLSTFLLAIITTLLLQILSNYANDYGDGIKGADKLRENQDRMVQSGKISKKSMKNAIVILSIGTLISGLSLLYFSLDFDKIKIILFFLLLGIFAIIAAIKYTVGNSAYGYIGLGDFFVFIFFGVIGVSGSFYLFTHTIHAVVLPGIFFTGFLSCAVLNLNNMRDVDSDTQHGKRTLVVMLGLKGAKIYHYFLLLLSLASFLVIIMLSNNNLFFISTIPLILVLINLKNVFVNRNVNELDGELKKIALSCFLSCLTFYVLTQLLVDSLAI
jgi:1,4-dihydroxy-2-naphthoate octaprenyltransferase